MRNITLILLSTLMSLLAFSSCDETELINPQDERVTLNTGAGNGTVDDNDDGNSIDGTYTLDEEDMAGIRTSAGGTTIRDLDADPMDTRGTLTTVGTTTVAGEDINTTNGVRTSYDNEGNRTVLTADPIDAVDSRQTYYSGGGMWDHKRPRETNRTRSTLGKEDTDNLTPVMPEDVEAETLRSRSSSMQ